MILDGVTLSNGSRIYHLTLGFGKVVATTASSAIADIGGQHVPFNQTGRIVDSAPSSPKMIGIGIPVQVWPEGAEDVTKLIPIIEQAIVLMRL
jgi:hypothetical protein